MLTIGQQLQLKTRVAGGESCVPVGAIQKLESEILIELGQHGKVKHL